MQNTSEQRKDEVCLHVDLFKKKKTKQTSAQSTA